MNNREKILIVVTAFAAILYVFFNYFYDGAVASLTSTESGSLTEEKSRFDDYAKTLDAGRKIQDEYERLTLRNVPESRPNERPGVTFTNELARILMSEFNQPSPRIEPYQLSAIPKVEDYYFIDIQVALDGKVDDLIRLLTQMEARGLLIKDFSLEVRGPGVRGNATLNVKVSRLVQHDKFSRAQLKARRVTGR